MSEPVLTVAKRVVDAPPLNLGVTGVARLDQVIRRSARRPLEIVDPALKRACAAVGLPFDPACPQKLVQLTVLVAGNMVATGPIRKARVLLRVGSHAVQRIPEAVVVLGLDVHAVHPVVHRAGAWNPVGRRNRRAAVEYIPGPAHAHMDPLGDLAVLGGRPAEDVLRRSHEVADGLHLPHGAEKNPILLLERTGERAGSTRCVQTGQSCGDLRGDMQIGPVGGRPLHRATSLRSSSPSERT